MPAGSRFRCRTAAQERWQGPAPSAQSSATPPVPAQRPVGARPPPFPPLPQQEVQMPPGQSHKTPHPDAAATSPSAPPGTTETAPPSAPAADAEKLATPKPRARPRSPNATLAERSTASVPASLRYSQKCLKQNSHICPQTPCPDVLSIEIHASLKRRVTPRRHLPQPGDSRSHVQPRQVFDFISRNVVQRVRPGAH